MIASVMRKKNITCTNLEHFSSVNIMINYKNKKLYRLT